MLPVGRRSDGEHIEKALSGKNPASKAEYELKVDGLEVSRYANDPEIVCDKDSPGLSLEDEIDFELGDVWGSKVECDVLISGVRTPVFRGEARRPKQMLGETYLACASPGYWISKIYLPEDMDFIKEEPWSIAHQALYYTPYSHISVDEVSSPRISRSGEDRFRRYVDSVKDVIDTVSDESSLRLRDRADESGYLYREPDLAGGGDVVWSLTVGVDVRFADFQPERNDAEYSRVVGYHEDENGEVEVLADVSIPNSRAPIHAVFPISVSEEDKDRASEMAYRAANRLAYGEYEQEIPLLYIHPLLERGDLIHISQPALGGWPEREFLAVIQGYSMRPKHQRMTLDTKMVRLISGVAGEARGVQWLSWEVDGSDTVQVGGYTRSAPS